MISKNDFCSVKDLYLHLAQTTLYTSNYCKSIMLMLYLSACRLVQERTFSLNRSFSWIRLRIV